MSGWMNDPDEREHVALTLPAEDDEYRWICSCGAGETEDCYEQARAAVNEHLDYCRLVQRPCAGLPKGQHWYGLVVTLAHDLADARDGFGGRDTDEIHDRFVTARAMLVDLEPGAVMCDMCSRWERDIGIGA